MHKLVTVFLFILPLFSFSQIATIELEDRSVPEPKSRDSIVDKWDLSQPGYQKLSQQARELLYWTNYSRNDPKKFWDSAVVPILAVFPPLNRSEANSLKSDLMKVGELPMFSLNDALIKTAQSHASDIGARKSPPSHISTNGTDFGTRMKAAGIKRCANENISISSQSILMSVILLFLDIDLPDLGHRKSLLNPSLQEIGVGSAPYGKDQYFLVQDLACVQP